MLSTISDQTSAGPMMVASGPKAATSRSWHALSEEHVKGVVSFELGSEDDLTALAPGPDDASCAVAAYVQVGLDHLVPCHLRVLEGKT
jgi:hypothetical protein